MDSCVPVCAAVRFIADDQGMFVSALGLLQDATGLLGAPRAKVRSFKRYDSLIADRRTALRGDCQQRHDRDAHSRGRLVQGQLDGSRQGARVPLSIPVYMLPRRSSLWERTVDVCMQHVYYK
eukprot:GHVO01056221.1.p1 GENE.GHVO01056221.1~~GHVO01056221.1.p1  ORF type:complete len:122 (-),score=1.51 GHVO01056221.1:199-564(-)